MGINQLDERQVTAYYNTTTSIAYITYRGELSAVESELAYGWLSELIEVVGTKALYGEVFDFREVKHFTVENLITAQKRSRRMNIMLNTQDFPVAMVVGNAMQEEILRGPMRIVIGNQRKRIVRSMDDAHAFLDEWHAENDAESV